MDHLHLYLRELEIVQGRAKRTLLAYRSDLDRFMVYLHSRLKRVPGGQDLSGRIFVSFLEKEKKAGFKPSTLQRRKVVLTGFAKYLNQRNLLTKESMDKVAEWRPGLWEEVSSRELRYLSADEVEKLTQAIRLDQSARGVRDLAMVSLILETGLATQDVIDLDLSNLSLRDKRLHISGDGERWFPIEKTCDFLEDYIATSRPNLTQSINEEALFISQMGARMSRQAAWQMIRGWGRASGLGEQLSPRILRHTAVKRMVDEGRTVGEIQNLLGHKNAFSTRALIRKIKYQSRK